MPTSGPDWAPLLPGMALWALALYLPLSRPLTRLEDALALGSLPEDTQQLLLVMSSLLLALVLGIVTDLVIAWTLGPGWGGSLALMAVLWGGFWSLASRRKEG